MKLYHSQSISINFNQLSLILFLCIYSSGYYAQNNGNNGQGVTQWKTTGNIADSNHYIGTKNEFPVKFRTNDIERFRITPEGNIGIGTTLPAGKLDVNGDVIFRTNVKLPGLTSSNGLSNDILFVDGNGQVTRGHSSQLAIIIYEPKLCSELPIPNPTWQHGLDKIYTSCPQVKVGINNDNPRVHLDVNGTSYSNFLSLGGDPTIMGTDLVRFRIKGYSLTNNSNLFEINNNSNLLFSISNLGDLNLNGRIVVNSTNNNPFVIQNGTEKLVQIESDGLLRARRVKIDQDSWSDYVFEDNFILMSLSEVEKYISKNKRLPDMPSTQEVQTNGVDLAEMNSLLLKKIEELMLYTIDQQKEIDLLKNEMLLLKK